MFVLAGHVDPGESEMDTAFRETEEESGLKKSQITVDPNFKSEMFYEVRGNPKRVVYWLAQLNNPQTAVNLSHEHQNYKWAEINEACNISKFKEMQKALNDAEAHIRSKMT